MKVPLPLAQIVLSALNHLLAQQPALADSLAKHAGRHLRIVVELPGPLARPAIRSQSASSRSTATPSGAPSATTDARIGADGHLVAVSERVQPAVTLTASPSLAAITGLLRQGPEGLAGHLRIEGDVILAAAIGQVARAMRWDYEEDLSRVVGDVAAYRIGEGLRGAVRSAGDFGERAREALTRAATTSTDGAVAQREMQDLADDLADVSARLARLEARADALVRRPGGMLKA